MNSQLITDLLRLLEIKKELLVRMLDALKRSALMLREDDMDAFSTEMENCKEITAAVDELGITESSLRAQIPDAQQQSELIKLESGIVYILEQIERTRRECNDIAQQKLQVYGQQIKAVRHTKRGIDGYANQFQRRDAVFIDAKK